MFHRRLGISACLLGLLLLALSTPVHAVTPFYQHPTTGFPNPEPSADSFDNLGFNLCCGIPSTIIGMTATSWAGDQVDTIQFPVIFTFDALAQQVVIGFGVFSSDGNTLKSSFQNTTVTAASMANCGVMPFNAGNLAGPICLLTGHTSSAYTLASTDIVGVYEISTTCTNSVGNKCQIDFYGDTNTPAGINTVDRGPPSFSGSPWQAIFCFDCGLVGGNSQQPTQPTTGPSPYGPNPTTFPCCQPVTPSQLQGSALRAPDTDVLPLEYLFIVLFLLTLGSYLVFRAVQKQRSNPRQYEIAL